MIDVIMLVLLVKRRKPHSLSVGSSSSIGIGEKYFKPTASAGFFNRPAMRSEKINKKNENVRPAKNSILTLSNAVTG
jgi:hypothetical protein